LGNLIPGETLIYERVDKTVYARYANRPDVPRWIIGGELPTVLGYNDWKKMMELSDINPTFKKELDKVINLYYIIKDSK
jgi:hypothetical protein